MIVFGVLLWCVCGFAVYQVNRVAGVVAARFDSAGVSPAALDTQMGFLREDGAVVPRVTLWFDDKIRRVYGYIEDVILGDVVAGGFPTKGEEGACAVSTATAFEKWGSFEVIGKTLTIDGEDYTVRGVIEDTEDLVVAQVGSDDLTEFSHVVVHASVEEAKLLFTKFGFDGAVFIDYSLWAWAAAKLLWLPGYVLACMIITRFSRGFYAVIASFVWFLVYESPRMPQNLIPNKWADLAFWGRTVGNVFGDIRVWLEAPTHLDFFIIIWLLVGLVASICAVGLLAYGGRGLAE